MSGGSLSFDDVVSFLLDGREKEEARKAKARWVKARQLKAADLDPSQERG